MSTKVLPVSETEMEDSPSGCGPSRLKNVNWAHFFLGNYDFRFLCMPQWPYCRDPAKYVRRESPFFPLHAHLGIVTALIMGFQHCLAMAAGLITPPMLIGLLCKGDGCQQMQTYLIQAALLVCGISSLIQVVGIRIGSFMWGAGILSVMGVSFTSVGIWMDAISTMMAEGKTFAQAYGAMLGTTAICAITPILISFVPFGILRKVFPPVVTSATIMLIGISLVGAGFKNWGGGAGCYPPAMDKLCFGNGNVLLPFGDAEYVGMGFFCFALIIIFEIFGSPFFRNGAVFLSLIIGYIFACIVPSAATGAHFTNTIAIDAAPVVTFLWTTRFPLSVHPPAILPMIIVFLITAIECIGDITATCEASQLPTSGPELMARIKGSLSNNGITSIFGSLAFSMPLTTFAQNNGIIALTNVASRQAGYACAFWLTVLGIFAKFGGWVLSIPNCIMGGMTTFLFANLISSGIKILMAAGPLRRRERFILTCGMALGIGVTLVPELPTFNLWPAYEDPNSVAGVFRASVLSILAEGFCLCAVVTVILNLIMPQEEVAESQLPEVTIKTSPATGPNDPLFSPEEMKRQSHQVQPIEGNGFVSVSVRNVVKRSSYVTPTTELAGRRSEV